MNAPLPFQQFQYALARHLRDPRGAARPAGVAVRRAGIYRELLRNNLESFLLACFPLTHALLGARRWRRLVDLFLREARCQTPYFREIPREFLRWLLAAETLPVSLPAWTRELAHYEWVELAVETMETAAPPAHEASGDLLAGRPVLAPALMNLAYAWPVQRISRAWRPRKPHAAHLLVFRDAEEHVRFIELNPFSARLIALLQTDNELTGEAACLRLAEEIVHPDAAALCGHGGRLLDDLRVAGAVLGAAATNNGIAKKSAPARRRPTNAGRVPPNRTPTS